MESIHDKWNSILNNNVGFHSDILSDIKTLEERVKELEQISIKIPINIKDMIEKQSEIDSHKYFHHNRQDIRYIIQKTFEDGFERGADFTINTIIPKTK